MSGDASEITRLRAELATTKAELAQAQAVVSASEAMISHLKLELAKLRREQYGRSSERRARLIEQMELQLEELEAAATEDALRAETVAQTTPVRAFDRRRARRPFPEHLPRERVVVETPTVCSCCGSSRIVKMGEDITETLEVIPRQWKVIRTVREKFTCRDCEKISQPPAPFHAIPRGWAGPGLIAMVAFEKYGQHQPLNRQAERFAREGVDLSLSTLADLIGHATVALEPLHALIAGHVRAADRLHGDDTTVRSWPGAGPGPRGSGPMCATIAPLRAGPRPPRCSSSRLTARRPTRTGISPGGAASCRPTPMAATTTSTGPIALRGR